jgi:hypothetical protein
LQYCLERDQDFAVSMGGKSPCSITPGVLETALRVQWRRRPAPEIGD